MKEGYRLLGDFIRQVDVRNTDGKEENLLGVSVQKMFIPSIANTVGTDFTKYKVVKRGQFTYIPDTSRRGDKIGIALLTDYDEGLVSNIYTVFEVKDENELLPEYLMLWFSRPEFDRYARFKSHGSVREIMDWDEMCKVKLPVPSIEKQRSIVKAYNTITDRIELKRKINDNLAETANALFCKMFFATSIAEKCDVGTFSQLIKETIGGDWGQEQPKGNYTSKVTCIRGTDIPALNLGSISAAPTRYILPKNLSSKRITADNIVVEISGGSPVQATGRVALIPDAVLAYHKEDLICSNFCRIMNIRSEYLYFFFQYWTYLYRNGVMFNYENSSTGLKNFNFSAFITEEKIQIPPIDIARRFNATLEPIYKKIFSVGFEIEKLVEARELLLPHLMLHDFSSR